MGEVEIEVARKKQPKDDINFVSDFGSLPAGEADSETRQFHVAAIVESYNCCGEGQL